MNSKAVHAFATVYAQLIGDESPSPYIPEAVDAIAHLKDIGFEIVQIGERKERVDG